MKKMLFFVLICLFTGVLSAQRLDDGSFENKWLQYTTTRTDIPVYWDYSHSETDDIIRTINSLVVIPNAVVRTELTAFRETEDVKDGDYAVRLTTVTFDNILLVPGVLGTITDDFISDYINAGGINVQAEFNFAPLALTGYYKYLPVNGDSAVIEVELYNEDIVIGSGKFIQRNRVEEWTEFTVNVHHNVPGSAVTHIRMLFISSAGYNFEDLMSCKGQVGSTLYIDDIKFSYESSITESILSDVKVKTYPNPATETVTFEFDQQMKGDFFIYNTLGSEVASYPLAGETLNVNVSTLEAGTYLFRVIDNNNIRKSGKFLVK
ncbi:MAG: T9SS type A sorting domain-containing protein [Bacteroidales bacterium]|jgi:hypothetical protein|nr:T9SS type A sorting domain-containing protein [Bacteroidales bacterium]